MSLPYLIVRLSANIILLLACAYSALGQPPWSLLDYDPRNEWPADSAIADARAQLDLAMRVNGDSSRAAIVAKIRLSEQLRVHEMIADSAECVALAESAFVQIRRSTTSDSLDVAAAYAQENALYRFQPLRDRYHMIRSTLDESGRCASCDSMELGKLLMAIAQTQNGPEQYKHHVSALSLFERYDNPDSTHVLYALWEMRRAAVNAVKQAAAFQLGTRMLNLLPCVEGARVKVYPTAGMVLRAHGENLLSMGRTADAMPLLEQGAEKTRIELGENSCAYARALQKVAECYTDLGVFEDGEAFFKRAIPVWDRCGESFPPYFLVSCLQHLGHEYLSHRRLVDAEQTLREAERIAIERNLGRGQDVLAFLFADLGRLMEERRDTARATQYYDAMLDLATTIYPFGDPRPGYFYQIYAEFAEANGQLSLAKMFQGAALALRKEGYGEKHPIFAEAVERSVWLEFEPALTPDSLPPFWWKTDSLYLLRVPWRSRTAWEIRYENFWTACSVLPPDQVLPFASAFKESSAQFMTLLMDHPVDSAKIAEQAQELCDNMTAIQWRFGQQRKEYSAEITDSLARQCLDSLQSLDKHIAVLIVQSLRGDKEHLNELDILKTARRSLWRNMSSAEWRGIRFEPEVEQVSEQTKEETRRRIQQLAADSTVVVSYLKYDHKLSLRTFESRYIALIFRPKEWSHFVVELGPATTIDAAVNRYCKEMEFANELDANTYRAKAQWLSRLIWEPLESYLRNSDDLLLAPDGELNHVSFASLIDSHGKYLIETHPLHYINSQVEYRAMLSAEPEPSMSSGVLAIGDPAFGDTVTAPAVANSVVPEESPVRRSGRSLLSALAQRTWERLPGSRAECAAAARLFGQGLPDEILLDDAATEQNFKVLASTRRLLYIATHGFTTKDDLGNQELLNLDSSHAYLAPFLKQNPLYTSGLVFSGANHFTTEYGADDGILTADEISRLNLRNVEVAILSACETGTGRIVNGEGAYAVRRGFELAGVRTILSTLWKVDDLASATLMKRMSAKRDLTIPQALRAAMLEELEARRRHGDSDHPYFWAGYVSSGDWRTQLHHTAHER